MPFCGLHELPMVACRITGQFLLTTFAHRFLQAWAYFPNANVDAEPHYSERTIDSQCCPECLRQLRCWENEQRARK